MNPASLNPGYGGSGPDWAGAGVVFAGLVLYSLARRARKASRSRREARARAKARHPSQGDPLAIALSERERREWERISAVLDIELACTRRPWLRIAAHPWLYRALIAGGARSGALSRIGQDMAAETERKS